MTDERFEKAVQKALAREPDPHEIGTLSERTVHAALKNYFEPDTACHEIKIGRHFADIYRDGEIVEIQTRAFYRLEEKLRAFLPEFRVTVVFPIITEKKLLWISPETGEASKVRRSPKHGNAFGVLPELYSLRDMIDDPNLNFCLAFITTEETRLACGRARDGKRFGARLISTLPTGLVGLSYIKGSADLKKLVPSVLADSFTRAEFARAAGLSERRSWYAIKTLVETGILTQCGKSERKIIYSRSFD